MPKVLIPQNIDEAGKIFLREKGYEVVMGSGHDESTIKREIADADAVIVRNAKYPADVIAAGKKLKIIARYGVGYDNIDIDAAKKQGIYVTITRGGNSDGVAEHTVMLILALAKKLISIDKQSRAGDWNIRNRVSLYELQGKTLGIVGLGAIGLLTAKICHNGFGMFVAGYDPYADIAKIPDYIEILPTLKEVLLKADTVSLHIPLVPETRNMINKDTLKLMRPSAYLINCGRGGIVNEEDLYNALSNGTISGAAFDVFDQEPPDSNNKLLALDNFIVTPHTAGLTQEAAQTMSIMAARAVDDALCGRKPEHVIN